MKSILRIWHQPKQVDSGLWFLTIRLFSLLGMKIDKGLVKHLLIAHKNYPSILSVYDVCQLLRIPIRASRMLSLNLESILAPCLLVQDSQDGPSEILLVNQIDSTTVHMLKANGDSIKQSKPTFEQQLSAQTFIIRPQIENKTRARFNLIVNKIITKLFSARILLLLLLVSIFTANSYSTYPHTKVLLTLIILGILITDYINYSHSETNQSSSFRLCKIGRSFDCEKVHSFNLTFASFRFPNFQGLATYFFWSQISILTFGAVLNFNQSAILLIQLTISPALLFTLISILIQALKVKAFCLLCLILTGIIWCQSSILLPSFNKSLISITLVSRLFIITILTAITLLTIRKFLEETKDYPEENRNLNSEIISLHGNHELMKTLYYTSKLVTDNSIENEPIIGNKEAEHSIILTLNPLCLGCLEALQVAEYATIMYPEQVRLIIRFAVDETFKETLAYKSVLNLLLIGISQPTINYLNNLREWYELKQIPRNRIAPPPDVHQLSKIDLLIKCQNKWIEGNQIKYTPYILLDGKSVTKNTLTPILKSIIE